MILAQLVQSGGRTATGVSQIILSTQVYFQVEYAAKPCFAAQIINQAKKSDNGVSLNCLIMQETVALKIQESLRTSSLFMPSSRSRLKFNCETENRVSMDRVIDYLRLMLLLKKDVTRVLQMKVDVLTTANKDRVFDLNKLYIQGSELKQLRGDIRLRISQVRHVAGDSCIPLRMIEAFYLVHVEYDRNRGLAIIRSMKNHKFKIGFRKLTEIDVEIKGDIQTVYAEKVVVVLASVETANFHKIILATSNIREYLEFKSSEIEGEDLSILVPQPFKSMHKDLMSPRRQTGVLLDSKTDQNLYVCTASKGIRNVKLSLRAVWNNEFGLCVAGRFNFDGETNRNNLLLLNK